jgi:hypothetical protein
VNCDGRLVPDVPRYHDRRSWIDTSPGRPESLMTGPMVPRRNLLPSCGDISNPIDSWRALIRDRLLITNIVGKRSSLFWLCPPPNLLLEFRDDQLLAARAAMNGNGAPKRAASMPVSIPSRISVLDRLAGLFKGSNQRLWIVARLWCSVCRPP